MRSLERIVAILSWCSSVRLSGTSVHCDHTVHFRSDLSLWLDSLMFWTPWHQSMSQPSFSSSTWKRWAWMCKLGVICQERLKIEVKLLLSAYRKSYVSRRLAQQRMTFSDLEWPFHTSRNLSFLLWFGDNPWKVKLWLHLNYMNLTRNWHFTCFLFS